GVVAAFPIAARRGRRCAHARARAPCAAGHAERHSPEDAARRMRARALSERRAASALARTACERLSASVARGDGENRGALPFLARRVALRISGGDRAAGRDGDVMAAQARRAWPREPVWSVSEV